MRVENLLTIFGILLTLATYAIILAAFTVIETYRNFYLFGSLAGLATGTMMLGLAKIINQQKDIVRVVDDLRRANRVQSRILNELKDGPQKTASAQKAAAGKPPRPDTAPPK